MRNIIIDRQSPDTWKIQLAIAIIFISSKDAEEECVMRSRSTKESVIKRKLKFENYKNYIEAAQIENKINH